MRIDLLNGNGHRYTTPDLTIEIIADFINEVAIKHWEQYADVTILKTHYGWQIKPTNALQVVRFLTLASTFCWEVCYTDNACFASTIYFRIKERNN